MDKQATLKDIAKLANVSIATVSRVVNGTATKAARPEIQNRIWEAVKELNYVPNTAAQKLKNKEPKAKLKTIACIFSRSSDFKTDPFFSEISRSIEIELLRLGYLMKFAVSTYEYPRRTINSLLSSEPLDGVILVGRTEKKYIDLIKKYNKNVIYVGLNKMDIDIDQIICDGYEAATKALEYLTIDGIENIYYLGESRQEVRYDAFRDFMGKRGIVDSLRNCVIETPFSLQKGYENLKIALAAGIRPRGLFCGNDLTALGAIKALNEFNLKIPQDVSIISIDNIEMGQFSSPMLTTMSVPMEQLGRIAAHHIVDKIQCNQYNQLPITISIPSTLIIRESARRPSVWNK